MRRADAGAGARILNQNWERLAKEQRSLAFRVARAVLDDADAAEDVAQEALLRLHEALPQLRDAEHAGAWMHTVTMNLCRDRLRTRRRRGDAVALAHSAAQAALTAELQPEADLDLERARAAVATAMQRLPEEQRQLLHLRYAQGYSYAEIAQLTQLPPGTVASRLYRALKQLGQEVDPWHMEVLK